MSVNLVCGENRAEFNGQRSVTLSNKTGTLTIRARQDAETLEVYIGFTVNNGDSITTKSEIKLEESNSPLRREFNGITATATLVSSRTKRQIGFFY